MASLRNQRRGTCAQCGSRCRTDVLQLMLLERFFDLLHWFEHRLLLCPACRRAFLDLVHQGRAHTLDELGAAADIAGGRTAEVASRITGWSAAWSGATPPPPLPRVSRQSGRDRRQSALFA